MDTKKCDICKKYYEEEDLQDMLTKMFLYSEHSNIILHNKYVEITKVIFNNKLIVLTPGAWKINDITLKEGENQIYLNSYDVHNYTWGDLITNSVTWGDFKTKRLFEWYKSNGTGNILMKTWDEVDESTWSDLSVLRWVDLVKVEDVPTDIENVIIKYDWGDL